MNDLTKDNKNNVSLIFDAKKELLNYSWSHYLHHPEMKKYLVNEHVEGQWRLRDERTNQVVMSASFSLERYLK